MAQAATREEKKGFFRSIWRFIVSVWVFMRSFFVLIGISVTVSVVCFVIIFNRSLDTVSSQLPDNIVLSYTFKAGITEVIGKPSLADPFGGPSATLRELVSALADGAKDARVKGFVAKVEDVDFSLAQVQELRAAIAAFRKTGKFAHVYADSYGAFSTSMGDYYFATAFDRIWLQPVGVVGITGLSMEVPFIKGFFDKIGVSAQFAHKGLYKSAPETLTDSDMSAPNREAAAALLSDLSRQIAEGIAEGRKMTVAQVRANIDAAPFSDKTALKAGLVDKLGYYDELLAEARQQAGLKEDDKLVSLTEYADKVDGLTGMKEFISDLRKEIKKAKDEAQGKKTAAAGGKKKIALVLASGEIVSFSGTRAAFGEGNIAANKIVKAFKDVRGDKDVAAVVFRIDSPGGSPTASETIRRAISQTQQAGKPVIVSMGSYAASGGYWVSATADKIVAQPATITGSIGVFGGKFVLAGLWEKLGVNWVSISEGGKAGMWSPQRPFTKEEFERFDAALGNIYDSFLDRVMEGRKMTRAQAKAVAEGRAWTGAQAREKGLVDELGGVDRAIELAKEAAKIDPAAEVEVEQFPPPSSPFSLFLDMMEDGAFFAPRMELRAEDLRKALMQVADEAGRPVLR